MAAAEATDSFSDFEAEMEQTARATDIRNASDLFVDFDTSQVSNNNLTSKYCVSLTNTLSAPNSSESASMSGISHQSLTRTAAVSDAKSYAQNLIPMNAFSALRNTHSAAAVASYGASPRALPKHYVCKICNIPGHFIQNCPQIEIKKNVTALSTDGSSVKDPKYKTDHRLSTDTSASPVTESTTPKAISICFLCKNSGHFIYDCPQKEIKKNLIAFSADNAVKDPKYKIDHRPSTDASSATDSLKVFPICVLCKKSDHLIIDCPQMKESENKYLAFMAPSTASEDSTSVTPQLSNSQTDEPMIQDPPPPPPVDSSDHVSVFVGNLTWWTTDDDIIREIQKFFVSDVIEVKFHEKIENGSSKGFATVVLGSAASAQIVLRWLPTLCIHGQSLVVAECNEDNLVKFDKLTSSVDVKPETTVDGVDVVSESISSYYDLTEIDEETEMKKEMEVNEKTEVEEGIEVKEKEESVTTPFSQSPSVSMDLTEPRPLSESSSLHNFHLLPPPDLWMPPPPQQPMSGSMLQPQFNNIPPQMALPPHYYGHSFPAAPPPHYAMMPFNMAPPPQYVPMNYNSPPRPMAHVFSQFMTAYDHQHHRLRPPPHGLPPPGITPPSGIALSGGGGRKKGAKSFAPISMAERSNYYMDMRMADKMKRRPPPVHLYKEELADILVKNKSVTSGAIASATQDAKEGQYGSAIETLVTAISLISQSKLGDSSSCQEMLRTLRDKLSALESESYQSKAPVCPLPREKVRALPPRGLIDDAVLEALHSVNHSQPEMRPTAGSISPDDSPHYPYNTIQGRDSEIQGLSSSDDEGLDPKVRAYTGNDFTRNQCDITINSGPSNSGFLKSSPDYPGVSGSMRRYSRSPCNRFVRRNELNDLYDNFLPRRNDRSLSRENNTGSQNDYDDHGSMRNRSPEPFRYESPRLIPTESNMHGRNMTCDRSRNDSRGRTRKDSRDRSRNDSQGRSRKDSRDCSRTDSRGRSRKDSRFRNDSRCRSRNTSQGHVRESRSRERKRSRRSDSPLNVLEGKIHGDYRRSGHSPRK